MESYCDVTVRRPDGLVETVRHPHIRHMTEPVWRQVVVDTEAAGRGTPLSYRNVTLPPREPDPQVQCDRCHATIARATAYHQQEWAAWGAGQVRVTAYYCAACHSLLTQIGAGDVTAMDDRAAGRPDNTPYTKQD